MLAVTSLNVCEKSTANSPSVVTEILVMGEAASIEEIFRFLLSQPAQLRAGVGLRAPLRPLVGDLLSEYLEQSLSTLATGSSQDNAADQLPAIASDEVQKLFENAESQLSNATEGTAQYGSKLLRRIRTLIADISARNITGRLLASVDEEEGSTRIEWIRDGSRLGFVLDRERESSSWFVVMPNGSSKSGHLYSKDDAESLRGILKEFVTAEEF